jgi:hypothetical protein
MPFCGECGLEEHDGAAPLLARHNLGESDAGVVVDGGIDELPTDTAAVGLSDTITGDAMADPVEATELFTAEPRRAIRARMSLPYCISMILVKQKASFEKFV